MAVFDQFNQSCFVGCAARGAAAIIDFARTGTVGRRGEQETKTKTQTKIIHRMKTLLQPPSFKSMAKFCGYGAICVALCIVSIVQNTNIVHAQNQLPATAPDEQTKDKLIMEQAVKIHMLEDHLRHIQMAPAPLPQAGYPDFLVFQNKGEGMWKMWSRDTNYAFAVAGTNILIHPK